MCAQNCLWSYHSHPEVNSDQTQIRPLPDDCTTMAQTKPRPLSRWLCASDYLWSYHSHPEPTSDHTIPRPKVTPDQTIHIWKRPLIRPFPSGSDLWSDHSHPQVTYDQTIPIRNQNPDPVIMAWEHTVCVGLRMIRGHFLDGTSTWDAFKAVVLRFLGDSACFVKKIKLWRVADTSNLVKIWSNLWHLVSNVTEKELTIKWTVKVLWKHP